MTEGSRWHERNACDSGEIREKKVKEKLMAFNTCGVDHLLNSISASGTKCIEGGASHAGTI